MRISELIDKFWGRSPEVLPVPIVEEKTLHPEGSINDVIPAIVGTNMEWWKIGDSKNSYSNNYVVYRGINLLASNLAQLPLRVYRGEALMPEDFVFPDGFSIYDPAPKQYKSLYDLIYETSIYYFYRGEWMNYVNLLEGSQRVLELVPVNPRHMKEVVDKQSGTITAWKWNNKNIMPAEQVVFNRFFDPDGLRGLGPIDVAVDEISTDRDALAFNQEYFKNYGKIGGILYDDKGEATTSDMERLVDQFNSRHVGAGRAYNTLGLPRGIKYDEALQTMREMEFLESRRDIRDRILLILGIHKALVGVTDSVDRAVAETAMRTLWQLTLRPEAIRIENTLNNQFFKLYYPEYRCKFDFGGVEYLRSGRVVMLEEAKMYRDLGYTINEINTELDLNMEDVTDPIGDMRLVPQNMIPAEDYLVPPEPLPSKAQEPIETKEVNSIDKSINRTFRLLQRKWEKKFHSKMSNFFSKQLIKILAVVKSNKAVGIDKLAILLSVKTILEESNEVLLSMLTPLYNDGSKEATAMAQNFLRVESNPHIKENIVQELGTRIKGVNQHTYNLVRREVVVAVDAGETIAQLSKRIENVGKFNASRSRLIARTESANLINGSTFEEYKAQGVPKKKWITAGDADVRETHAQNAAAGAIPMNQTFPGTGEMYPGEFNCRCAISPVVER